MRRSRRSAPAPRPSPRLRARRRPARSAESDTVLVLGDLVIDRSWLVGPEFAEKRVPVPGESLPRSLLEPDRQTDVAGGIGTVARAIVAIDPKRPVIAGGIWDRNVAENIDELVPPKKSDFPELAFRQLGTSKFTSIRHRIFNPAGANAISDPASHQPFTGTVVSRIDNNRLGGIVKLRPC